MARPVEPAPTKAESVQTTTEPTSPATLAPATAAVPPETFFSRRNVWIIAGAGAVALLAIVFLLGRRSRPVDKVSLITRSFDREKK